MEDSFDFLVVIPTHKRAEAVRAAIASALSQAGVTKQIIVADDCPEGSAAGVVKDFPEVIYLKNPHPSRGWPGRVRNFAFDFSHEMGTKAHYVHFLDDDDTVPEGHYAVVKETFRQHPNIGVVFGVLRPFSTFSDDPDRRTRQERQLEDVRKWRLEAASFPWLYQQVGRSLKLPVITQWLLCQHATFGPEMFLCSAGVIRHKHVLELRGFPDIRITQDYWFYTEAIKRFGATFLNRETAGYGVGDAAAVWNPLDLSGPAKVAHTNEWTEELRLRNRKLQADMGFVKYHALRILFRIQDVILSRAVIPALDRLGYFAELYRLTDPERFAYSTPASEKLSPHRNQPRVKTPGAEHTEGSSLGKI